MLAWFDRLFPPGLAPGRFALRVGLVSLAGLVAALWVYVALVPGFAAHLAGSPAARGAFARQVLTNGLPVVVVINAAALGLFVRLRAGTLRPRAALALDFAVRIGGFAALHGVIFAASALAFGSFGGDPAQGLAVLGDTLARAPAFGNIAGAYLYATAVSALPLHLAIAVAVLRGGAPVVVAGIWALQLATLAALGHLLAGI